jgi:hypothetical protein
LHIFVSFITNARDIYIRTPGSGYSGSDGVRGADGEDGAPAPCGAFSFLTLRQTPAGFESVASSPFRFEASPIACNVLCELSGDGARDYGGVFTPGSRVRLCDIAVLNDGGLALPSGAFVFVQSTPTVGWSTPVMFALPDVAVGATHVERAPFVGTLFDVPPPQMPTRLDSTATFQVETALLNRRFHWSTLTISIPGLCANLCRDDLRACMCVCGRVFFFFFC